jgi:hypothetical protein
MRFATSLTLLAFASSTAWAQAALDEDGTPRPTTEATASPTSLEVAAQPEYGAALRLRRVWVPQGMIDLFVERSGGGAANTGFGVELVRRRGNVEIQLGFEFENIQPGGGVWIAKGDNVAGGDEADYILTPEQSGKSLGWFTVEFTFLNHAPITDKLFVRYGGGAGIGFVTGELQKYDVPCAGGATNDNPEPGCVPTALGGNAGGARGPSAYNLPPVFPVVNAIIGLQIRPAPKAVINVEGGIRTFPFFGVSGGYFF